MTFASFALIVLLAERMETFPFNKKVLLFSTSVIFADMLGAELYSISQEAIFGHACSLLNSGNVVNNKIYTANLGNLEEGDYSYEVECIALTDQRKTFDFTVDRTKPYNVSVEMLPGCSLTKVNAVISGNDDESGIDEKLLCVPVDKLHPYYKDVKSTADLQPIILEQIAHFFEHYKDLEKTKWVKVQGWEGPEKAAEMIGAAIARAANC